MDFLKSASQRSMEAVAKVGQVAKDTGIKIKESETWQKVEEVAKDTGGKITSSETWDSIKTGTTKTFSTVSTHAQQGGQFLVKQASQLGDRMGIHLSETLEARCRQEASSTPCPRALIVCCNAIACGDMETPGIFKEDGVEDLVDMLFSLLIQGNGAVLIPQSTNPITIGAVIKKYLRCLPEPLLTYKLVNEFLNSGMTDTPASSQLLMQLPPANYNSLVLLLDCAKRVSEQSAANGMTSRHVAEELAPCLLWHPLPKDVHQMPQDAPAPVQEGPSELQALSDKELVAAANVMEHLIDHQV